MGAIFELHLQTETLGTEEVIEITGCQRKNDQVDWLDRNRWVYHTNKAGIPIIGRMYARMKMAGINPATLASPSATGWQADFSKVR